MSLTELLHKAKKELELTSKKAYQESLWILSHTLNLSANQIYTEDNSINSKQEKSFWKAINQRKQAVPLEYILKEKCFFGHKLYIEDTVFIPRLETELLVKWVCKNFKKNQALNFIDFGAGAGAIALSILHYFPNSRGAAVELYPKAISCLKKNSLNLDLQDRLYILQKDVSQVQAEDLYNRPLDIHNNIDFQISHPSFKARPPNKKLQQSQGINKKNRAVAIALDLITANPPYIAPKDKNIQKEVYLYESPLALFSDQNGLGHIITWFAKAMELLKPNGFYIFEFAWNQEEPVTEFLSKQTQIDSYKILKDHKDHPRLAVCVKKDS